MTNGTAGAGVSSGLSCGVATLPLPDPLSGVATLPDDTFGFNFGAEAPDSAEISFRNLLTNVCETWQCSAIARSDHFVHSESFRRVITALRLSPGVGLRPCRPLALVENRIASRRVPLWTTARMSSIPAFRL